MTKTEHYQLNQWDAGDSIRRADFNADNAAIDAALSANAQALADYRTANDAAAAADAKALADYRTANDAAVAANAQALADYRTANDAAVAANTQALADYQTANDAAVAEKTAANAQALADYRTANDAAVAAKAEQSALDSGMAAAEERIAALEQGVALVKLGAYKTVASNVTVTADLQNADMNAYTALLVFISAPKVLSTSGKLYLHVNEETLLELKTYNLDAGTIMAWMQPVGSGIMGGALSASSANTSQGSIASPMQGSSGEITEIVWQNIQSVGVSGTSAAGLTCVFYALKV